MLLLRNKSIALLFAGQALYWSCSMIGITLTALVGLQLAPLNVLATLPLALLVLGNLLAVQPLSLFLTSALAPLIRLSYGRMLWMALPYTVTMTLTGLWAVAVLI